MTDIAADKLAALAITPVSRETEARLDAFAGLLRQWNATTNLVAPSTLAELWTRHIADLLQLLDLAPTAKIWVDLGSGGGFPGIPIACALAGRPGAQIHLVESNGKKAAFLREAVRLTRVPATVHAERIENFGDSFTARADIVTARALAPLILLCEQTFPWIWKGAIGLFPKGQDVEVELTAAAKYWRIQWDLAKSRTARDGRILIVRHLEPRTPA